MSARIPDEPILYAMRSAEIQRALAVRFDLETVQLAIRLMGRLRRAHDARYRRVYLGLVDSVLGAIVSHRPHEFEDVARKLIRGALPLMSDLEVPDAAYLRGRIAHRDGVLQNQLGQYTAAIERYEQAAEHLKNVDQDRLGGQLVAERALLEVHRSAAMHLGGDSDRARSLAAEVDDQEADSQAAIYARIKLAEHCIVRDDISGAASLLGDLVEGDGGASDRPSPIYRTIALKDWAIVQAHGGERSAAVRAGVSGLVLAKELGFHDQEQKILSQLGELGIRDSDLRLT